MLFEYPGDLFQSKGYAIIFLGEEKKGKKGQYGYISYRNVALHFGPSK
jgi:hypothetical protein